MKREQSASKLLSSLTTHLEISPKLVIQLLIPTRYFLEVGKFCGIDSAQFGHLCTCLYHENSLCEQHATRSAVIAYQRLRQVRVHETIALYLPGI